MMLPVGNTPKTFKALVVLAFALGIVVAALVDLL